MAHGHCPEFIEFDNSEVIVGTVLQFDVELKIIMETGPTQVA